MITWLLSKKGTLIMQHRQKSQKKKSKRPGRPPLLLSEETLIMSLLKDVRDTDPDEIVAGIPDSRLAQVLIDRLPLESEATIPLLMALQENFEDKGVRKAFNRALFKLKKKGVQVDELEREEIRPSAILKPVREEAAAYLGPIADMAGSRSLLVILPRAGTGLTIGTGLVSDEGIPTFLSGTFSKKRTREIKEGIAKGGGPLVETSPAHAATILEEAYQKHLELHSESPDEYIKFRPSLLDNLSLLDRPIIYEFIADESTSRVPDSILTNSQLTKLFGHSLMESWLIDYEHLKPVVEEIQKTAKSPLLLTDAQKSGRTLEIIGKCVQELFPPPRRSVLKRRLEEMSYFFFRLDEDEYSRLCLAAARHVDKQDTMLNINPVVEFLVQRSLDFYNNMSKRESATNKKLLDTAPSSGIILP